MSLAFTEKIQINWRNQFYAIKIITYFIKESSYLVVVHFYV